MQFTFKRDEEGRESVYDDKGTLVAEMSTRPPRYVPLDMSLERRRVIIDAIERADKAGFWDQEEDFPGHKWRYLLSSVTVDVPVAETSTTLVVVREGE